MRLLQSVFVLSPERIYESISWLQRNAGDLVGEVCLWLGSITWRLDRVQLATCCQTAQVRRHHGAKPSLTTAITPITQFISTILRNLKRIKKHNHLMNKVLMRFQSVYWKVLHAEEQTRLKLISEVYTKYVCVLKCSKVSSQTVNIRSRISCLTLSGLNPH